MRRGIDASATPNDRSPSFLPDTRAAVEMGARHLIEPYRQGGLDKFCGLYSTLNGMRLAMAHASAPLSPGRCHSLFAAGIGYLENKGGLGETATDGMGLKRRLGLARYLGKQLCRPGLDLAIERPEHKGWASIDHVFAWIAASLAEGKPVLISLAGPLDHYSVVSGINATTLQLFDSCALKFIRRSSCSFKSGRHQIAPNGLLRIAVSSTG